MARMIPDISPEMIDNNGERLFYTISSQLPDDYTVLYSYKFYIEGQSIDQIREADFVIVHPALGFVVVEVKQGEVAFHGGQWQEYKNGDYQRMHKDPLEQARSAMYEILKAYRVKTGGKDLPLKFRYALAFPECASISGVYPPSVKAESVWTSHDIDQLEDKIWSLFDVHQKKQERIATQELINLLSPNFKLFSSLEDQIATSKKSAQGLMTEEQNRILDETEDDRRKIFFGTAGTGKTFVVMEKARRLATQGKNVVGASRVRFLLYVFHQEGWERVFGDKVLAGIG